MSPAPEPKIDPAVSRASNPAIEFLALPETVRQWEGLLCSGKDYFHMLPDGITEAKARKMARAKWGEFGRELVAYWAHYWGEAYARESWAWKRWGAP
jgi:hypothetical protein